MFVVVGTHQSHRIWSYILSTRPYASQFLFYLINHLGFFCGEAILGPLVEGVQRLALNSEGICMHIDATYVWNGDFELSHVNEWTSPIQLFQDRFERFSCRANFQAISFRQQWASSLIRIAAASRHGFHHWSLCDCFCTHLHIQERDAIMQQSSPRQRERDGNTNGTSSPL